VNRAGLFRPAAGRRSTGVAPAGFTLIELILSVSLMALLSALLAGLFANCRKTSAAADTAAARLRTEALLRESIQSEVDLSYSSVNFESADERVRGFAIKSYGSFGPHRLKIYSRYLFQPDETAALYQLVRHVVPEGIGVRETKDILMDNIGDPVFEAYSEAAAGFVPLETLPVPPDMVRVRFRWYRNRPLSAGDIPASPFDEIVFFLSNETASASRL